MPHRTIGTGTALGLALFAGAACVGEVGPRLPADPGGEDDPLADMDNKSDQIAQVAAALGDPLPGLTTEQMARFTAGKEEFEAVETVADGLGPVFNDVSCAACHSTPSVGGSSTTTVTRFGTITNGSFDPLANLGGSLIQVRGIGMASTCNFTGETVPPQATIVAKRRTTPLFGFGLIDSVPESTFSFIRDFEAHNFPSTAGRFNVVDNPATSQQSVGRFGWKAQVPSVFVFAGDAYLNEMGITNPLFPNENCPNGDCSLLSCNPKPELNDDGADVQKFADFMTLLAPPSRGPITPTVRSGESVFVSIGCNRCHWRTVVAGGSDIAAINRRTFHPFSDFMLHDMGTLGDGIEQGRATGVLMRTSPLWGLRAETSFLHDGRATTIEQAILAHDGQARAARDRFTQLGSSSQSALLAFLNSL